MKRIRRGVTAGLLVVLVGAAGASACSDNGSGSGGSVPSTRGRTEDAPDLGPQSGPNPAGGEPAPGSAPANG
jgi:hypothetical protein